MNKMTLKFISIVFFSSLLFACSRPASKIEVSSLNLNLESLRSAQSIKTMGTEEILAHVVITISGVGLPAPIVLNWDAEHPSSSCSANLCQLIVPSGKQRFIQLLGVYQNENTETMSFYYGDTYQDLLNADESIAITISSISTDLLTKEVEFKGRFLTDADGTGPTGPLEIRFKPGEGKASMLIESTDAFSGWFRAFGLTGINFEYSINGMLLENGAFSIEKLLNPGEDSQVIVEWPEHYEQMGSSTPPYRKRGASTQLFGFFGPYRDLGVACYSTTAADFSWSFSDIEGLTKLHYSPTISDGNVYINNTTSNSCNGLASGSQPIHRAALYIDPTRGGFEFKGPYINGSNHNYINWTMAGELITLNWTYLPDVQNQLSGSRVFAIINGDTENYRSHGMDDGLDCRRLQNLTSQDPNIVLIADSNSNSLNFAPANYGISPYSAVVLCAFKDEQLFSTGVSTNFSYSGGGGYTGGGTGSGTGGNYTGGDTSGGTGGGYTGGDTSSGTGGNYTGGGGYTGGCTQNCNGDSSSGQPAAKIHIEVRQEPKNYVSTNSCIRLGLEVRDANNLPTNAFNSDLYFTIAANGTALPVYGAYNWDDCLNETNSINSPYFMMNDGHLEVYIKNTSADGTNLAITAYGINGSANITADTAISILSVGTGYSFIHAEVSSQLLAGLCYPVEFTEQSLAANTYFQSPNSSRTLDFSSSSAALSFYNSNTDCLSSVSPSTITIPANASTITGYVKIATSATSSSTPYSLRVHVVGSATVVENERYIWLSSGPNNPTRFNIIGSYSVEVNTCARLDLELQNDYGASVFAPSSGITGFNYSINNSSGSFFNSPSDCDNSAGALTFPYTLTANINKFTLWFKPNTITTGTAESSVVFTTTSPSISAPGTNAPYNSSYRFTVTAPPEANNFEIRGFSKLSGNICNELEINLVSVMGQYTEHRVSNSSTKSFSSFTLNSGTLTPSFYTNSDCTTGSLNGNVLNLPAGTTSSKFYVKFPQPSYSDSGTLSIEGSPFDGGSTINNSININTGSMSNITNLLFLDTYSTDTIDANMCKTFTAMFVDSAGYPSKLIAGSPAAKNIHLSLMDITDTTALTPASTNVDFYASCASSTPITTGSLTVNDYKFSFALKSSSTNPAREFNMKVSSQIIDLNSSTIIISNSVFFNPNPVADHLKLFNQFGGGTITAGTTCMQLKVETQNATMVATPIPSTRSMPFEIYANYKGEFSDTGCNGYFTNYLHSNISAGSSSQIIYFRPIVPGPLSAADFQMWGHEYLTNEAGNIIDSSLNFNVSP